MVKRKDSQPISETQKSVEPKKTSSKDIDQDTWTKYNTTLDCLLQANWNKKTHRGGGSI